MAKANIERLYPIVAVLERMDDTILLLDAKMNNIFDGLSWFYRKGQLNTRKNINT